MVCLTVRCQVLRAKPCCQPRGQTAYLSEILIQVCVPSLCVLAISIDHVLIAVNEYESLHRSEKLPGSPSSAANSPHISVQAAGVRGMAAEAACLPKLHEFHPARTHKLLQEGYAKKQVIRHSLKQ